ncbi:MAG: thioredoxin family protein [Kiritimatiellae bacterium]|nr:thioredoxin family protein [Kiritimatiellia bacterium]
MNTMSRVLRVFGLAVIVFLSVLESRAVTISNGEIQRGVWNSRFTAAKEYAEKRYLPMLIYWGGKKCSYCNELDKDCCENDFLTWQARRQLVMVHCTGTSTSDASAALNFAQNSTGLYPYICVYWPKYDGTTVIQKFSGRNGKMLVFKRGMSHQEQLMQSVDQVLVGYDPNLYLGGVFTAPGTPKARLEAEAGVTTRLFVPMKREDEVRGFPATNVLTVAYPDGTEVTNLVAWTFEDHEQFSEISVPADVTTGQSIQLKLWDTNGKLMGTNVVTVVDPVPMSSENPLWIGERTVDTLQYGEWTMDLDVAKAKVAADPNAAYTLIRVTGELWCPYCKGSARSLLADPAFYAWAQEKRVALVLLDNVRLIDNVPSDSPTLLSHTVSARDMASGSGYLSRKMATPELAAAIAARNKSLGMTTLKLKSSSAVRVGNPTFILLRKDGSIAGRLAVNRENTRTDLGGEQLFRYPTDENIARLNDLLLLDQDGNEDNDAAYTTALTYQVGDTATSTLQINDSKEVFRLAGINGHSRVLFSTDNPAVSVSVLAGADPTNFTTEVIAKSNSGEQIAVDISDENAKKALFVQMTLNTVGMSAIGASTRQTATLQSVFSLIPEESQNEYETTDPTVYVALDQGVTYRLVGFGDVSAYLTASNADAGLYVANATGAFPLPVATGTVSYQIWKPGTVAFERTAQRISEINADRGTIRVVRSGGSSGAVTVAVALDAENSTAANGVRYSWTDTQLSWADGETGTKEVSFTVTDNHVSEGEQTFLIKLQPVGETATTVSDQAHTVTLFDKTDPYIEEEESSISLYSTFAENQSIPIYNIGSGRVTTKKVSGKLPSGVKVTYDAKTKSFVISGTPRATGKFTVGFSVTEVRADGKKSSATITLTFTVTDPKKVNPYASRKLKMTLPLFASVGGVEKLAGELILSTTAANKISARYAGTVSKTASFSGAWQSIGDDGTMNANLDRNGAKLALSMTKNGFLHADVTGVSSMISGTLTSGDLRYVAASGYVPYAGTYTVTLPAVATDGKDSITDYGAVGTAFLTFQISSKSSIVQCKGILPNGKSVTTKSYLFPLGDGTAILPVFKRSASDIVAAALAIRTNAAQNYREYPMAVLKATGTRPFWYHKDAAMTFTHELEVYGSYYNPQETMNAFCAEYYATTQFDLAFNATGNFLNSPKFGAIATAPEVLMQVTASAITFPARKDLKFTFQKKTGMFNGRATVKFSNGKSVSCQYKGVLLPGWADCGCMEEEAIIERPYGSGCVWFTDNVKGRSAKRGFTIDLLPHPAE